MSTGKSDPHPSQREYDIVVQAMRDMMGEEFFSLADQLGVNLENIARFTPLSSVLEEARKAAGLSVKALAKQLKATQAVIKAIEGSSLSDVDGAVLVRCADALGQRAFFDDWVKVNAALAFQLGVPGIKPPPLVILPDSQPGGTPPRLLGEGEKLVDPEVKRRAAELNKMLSNIPAGLLEAFDEVEKPAKKKARPATAAGAMWRMKIKLLNLAPPIWRRFTVPDSITLGQLHDVIQIVMGWTNSHLHAFEIKKERYERPYPNSDFGAYGPEPHDERKVTLASLGLRARSKFRYEYDFGDGWMHELALEKILPPVPGIAAVCEAGEYACPPEDCGGPFAYPGMLDTANDPTHPDHEHIKEWLGEFDPFHFPHEEINRSLSRLSARWSRKR